ncbi:MAG: hypothetical protein C4520_20125 [Candidatus Abyssobacteria bacterium SURF_5]|uniref:Glycoside hydrolase family 2 n=1 Tax=Abyssobacteria bacterium (strain SURF_5) TaxID=2093360 RepID=A0A3A4NF99_ABYX5|nr:MAG: hypothetical protein C4520_20125 [Candidatus Abyssubacteria bacterium SURF_5]
MKEWRPVKGNIMTRWAAQFDPAAPLPEYPRPQMVRRQWRSLNGLWDYAVTPRAATSPEVYEGKILVPFAIETALSGVKRPLLPDQLLWYRRFFTIPDTWKDRRILLHFEAVDWQCDCYVNRQKVGSHAGGYVPFTFDISEVLAPGENELVVSVWDPTDSHWQQKGKQVLQPESIYYTATSGIWQTVWVEPVHADNYIVRLKLVPKVDNEALEVEVFTRSEGRVSIAATSEGVEVGMIEGVSGHKLRLPVPNPHLWSPQDPFLYSLKVDLLKEAGVIDSVESYFGMRKISAGVGQSGHKRILLNGKPIFLHGPLDQGYWPDGGMTPPSDEALIFDIEKTLELGFNMTRKHVKVEPRRWYYHADRLGLLVIQDMPSGGKNMLAEDEIVRVMFSNRKRKDTGARSYRKAWRESAEARRDFEAELAAVIEHLRNAPSIAIWTPFNESWGQFDAARISESVKRQDPSRLVDHASGWLEQGAGDFCSRHVYVLKLKKPPRNDTRIYFISEYGGYNYQETGHLWNGESEFGYAMFPEKAALHEAYANLIRTQIMPLIPHGLGAAVYTQFSDVEIETNGFFTYDREILKFDMDLVRALNCEIYEAFSSSA